MEEVKKTKKKNKVASLLLALALILTCGVAGTIAQYQKSLGGTSEAKIAKFSVDDNNTVKNIDLFNASNLFDSDDESAAKGDSDVAPGKIAPGTQGYTDITLTNNSEVNVKCELTAVLGNDTDNTTPTGQILATAKNSYVENSETYKGKYIPLQYAVEAATGSNNLSTINNTLSLPVGVNWSTADETQNPFSGLSTALEKAIQNANKQVNSGNETTNIGMNSTMKVRIYWKWDIKDTGSTDARNELDTVIGEAMANSSDGDKVFRQPKLKVNAKFVQVD